MGKTTKDCTIMFVDIAGSTRLYQEYGDTLAQDSIARCLIRLSEIIKRHRGTVVKFIGDEILCYLQDPELAFQAAFKLQEIAKDTVDPNGVQLSLRIGMHFGSAIIEDTDLYGDSVNVAAAMRDIAKGGQIIATEEIVAHIPPEISHFTRRYDTSRIKGRQEQTTIYEILWEGEASTQILSGTTSVEKMKSSKLQLAFQETELALLANMPALTLGRDYSCSIIIEGTLISRQHASIEYRRGKFLMIDKSTNGTYILTEDGRSIYLRREEFPLWGKGKISLGKTIIDEDTQDLIHYTTL
ncbi:MAG: adenylate/guanylate cyclase domain-containing protein [Gammaproteobacteria bacterium]|nr:adenylate/guanylate cyclase domain-containing protein [Gammaproteobacteria bacterium]